MCLSSLCAFLSKHTKKARPHRFCKKNTKIKKKASHPSFEPWILESSSSEGTNQPNKQKNQLKPRMPFVKPLSFLCIVLFVFFSFAHTTRRRIRNTKNTLKWASLQNFAKITKKILKEMRRLDCCSFVPLIFIRLLKAQIFFFFCTTTRTTKKSKNQNFKTSTTGNFRSNKGRQVKSKYTIKCL